MANYSLLDSTGLIVNRIVLNDPADWSLPEGLTLILEEKPMALGGTIINGVYTPPPQPPAPPLPPPSITSQDLMAQFTPDDATKIKAATDGNISFWLLWSALQAQSAPMETTSDRFVGGWKILIKVLGADRMNAIAKALNVPSLVSSQ